MIQNPTILVYVPAKDRLLNRIYFVLVFTYFEEKKIN